MSALPVAAGPAPSPTSSQVIALAGGRCLAGFEAASQEKILPLIESSRTLGDLVESFPALLYALATGHGAAEARARTIAAVESGASLRHAAAILGLPWWLRRLPASAIEGSLAGLPHDPELGQRLVELLPDDPVVARFWLRSVAYCCRACSLEFGVWVASWIGRSSGLLVPITSGKLRLLAAWGWASTHRDSTIGTLLRRPWTPAIGPRRALEEVAAWRQRIDLGLQLSARPPATDLGRATVLGYEFVPLGTAREFIAEAIAMDNCLDQYGDRLAARQTRIFSIRREGRIVADIEVGGHDEEPTMPAIRQLRGPRNRRASAEIWRATYAWLGTQPLRAITQQSEPAGGSAAARRAAALELWRAYIDDRAAALPPEELKELIATIDDGGPASQSLTRQRRQASRASGAA